MIRPLLRSIAFVLALWSAPIHALGMLPLSGSQQFDNATGTFMVGGQMFTYLPGSTTPITVYADVALMVPFSNPIVLGAGARVPPIYAADGTVIRLRIINSAGIVQTDLDQLSFVTAPMSTSPTIVTPQQLWQTGDVKVRYDDQLADGFVRMNGRTIGDDTSAATELASTMAAHDLFVYLWPFPNVTVISGKGASAAADWGAHKQLVLPNMSGRLIAGRDDMGNGPANNITTFSCTTPSTLGTTCGFQGSSITVAQLPAAPPMNGITFSSSGTNAYTPAGSVSPITPAGTVTAPAVTITESAHQHTTVGSGTANAGTVVLNGVSTGGGTNGVLQTGAALTGFSTSSNSTGITAALATTPTFNGTQVTPTFTGTGITATLGNLGNSDAFETLPPVMLLTYYIKL